MRRAIPVCMILIAFLSACTKDQAPGITCQSCAAISISFNADIIPIFKANCTANCHTGPGATAPGRISLDSAIAYAQVTHGGTGYVIAGNANYSLLYTQLLTGSANHMPLTGQLDPCTIQKIFCWIQQGALNN